MSKEAQLREEICATGASLFQRGYTVGSAGNISARLEDGWLITPTDACLGLLTPGKIAKVDASGRWIAGDQPSKTLALHRMVYDNNPEVHGVVHTHSTYLVKLSIQGVWSQDDVLPPITPYYVMKVGHIPLIDYHRPGAPEVAQKIQQLAGKVRGVLLQRLGPVMWENSVSKAACALEELEETAKLWHLAGGNVAPLDLAALQELREVFNARW